MATTIAVSNMKGGVGKTMTTASLGAGLARQGKKVLCIDADPQHSLTISLGIVNSDCLTISISTIMSNIINDIDFELTDGVFHHQDGIDILPANSTLAGLEIALAGIIGRETILRQYIKKVSHLYDYILLDCAPSLDLLTINALAASDNVIIPVVPRYLDAKGLELLLKSISQVRKVVNPELSIGGILLTMVDSRTNLAKDVVAMIANAYGGNIRIFREYIPHSVRAAESSATGRSIYKHDPNGKVATAYAALVKEVLENAA